MKKFAILTICIFLINHQSLAFQWNLTPFSSNDEDIDIYIDISSMNVNGPLTERNLNVKVNIKNGEDSPASDLIKYTFNCEKKESKVASYKRFKNLDFQGQEIPVNVVFLNKITPYTPNTLGSLYAELACVSPKLTTSPNSQRDNNLQSNTTQKSIVNSNNLQKCVGPESTWTNCLGEFTDLKGVIYSVEYRNGKKEGYGYETYPNGTKYRGYFKNGVYDGEGYYLKPSGEIYMGGFANGKYQGKGKIFSPDGSDIEAEFQNGEINGFATLTNSNGEKICGMMKGAKLIDKRDCQTRNLVKTWDWPSNKGDKYSYCAGIFNYAGDSSDNPRGRQIVDSLLQKAIALAKQAKVGADRYAEFAQKGYNDAQTIYSDVTNKEREAGRIDWVTPARSQIRYAVRECENTIR
jgi:hypothetical protein